MSLKLKSSGKSFELPEKSSDWTFTRRPGGWVIAEKTLPNGHVVRKRLAAHEASDKFSFNLDGETLYGEFQKKSYSSGDGADDSDLVAQFPGKVRKVLVSEGNQVGTGEELVLIEAMKMEFTVKAPFDGLIKRIHVQSGQQLLPGDRFVDLEATT